MSDLPVPHDRNIQALLDGIFHQQAIIDHTSRALSVSIELLRRELHIPYATYMEEGRSHEVVQKALTSLENKTSAADVKGEDEWATESASTQALTAPNEAPVGDAKPTSDRGQDEALENADASQPSEIDPKRTSSTGTKTPPREAKKTASKSNRSNPKRSKGKKARTDRLPFTAFKQENETDDDAVRRALRPLDRDKTYTTEYLFGIWYPSEEMTDEEKRLARSAFGDILGRLARVGLLDRVGPKGSGAYVANDKT